MVETICAWLSDASMILLGLSGVIIFFLGNAGKRTMPRSIPAMTASGIYFYLTKEVGLTKLFSFVIAILLLVILFNLIEYYYFKETKKTNFMNNA